jgi:hypothetical protein
MAVLCFSEGKKRGMASWTIDPRVDRQEFLGDSNQIVRLPIRSIARSPQGDALPFLQDWQIWLLK